MDARRAVLIGAATSAIGVLALTLPAAAPLEEAIAVGAFVRVRGAAAAPRQVVVVSIDEATAAHLQLPTVLRDWPRRVYGELVRRLAAAGVSAIAFDIQFFRHSADPQDDEQFGAAIEDSGRVVLVQRVRRVRVGDDTAWERQLPVPRLMRGAVAVAPVPVPDTPIVTSFWSFLSMPEGDVPSLPSAMLQVYTRPVFADFVRMLEDATAINGSTIGTPPLTDLSHGASLIRRAMTSSPSVAQRLFTTAGAAAEATAPERRQWLDALIAMYSGEAAPLLNLYGPPGSICTIPFDAVLQAAGELPCPLRGSAVFVGMGSSRIVGSEQPDTFHTVFIGTSLSGVELQATAFANLLTRTAIRPAGAGLSLLLFVCGGLLFGAAPYVVRSQTAGRRRLWSRGRAAATALAAALLYCAAAYAAFTGARVLVPIAVLMLVQLPAGVLLAIILPAARRQETVTAVCLVSDAGGSTAVGDRFDHAVYDRLMREYHDALSGPVLRHGGEPLNPKGDGFLCVWRTSPASVSSLEVRRRACIAALEMSEASSRLNERLPPEQRLPTRIGLHVGPVTIAADADRGTFDVVGQAANVAARLQGLNRTLRTCVLASQDVVEGLDEALTLRRLDWPVALEGISHTPVVFEVCGTRTLEAIPRRPVEPPAAAAGGV